MPSEISLMLLHPLKAAYSIFVILAPNVTFLSAVQFSNAFLSTLETLSPKTISSSILQPRKALLLIFVILSGIVISFRFLQFSKTPTGTSQTLCGNATLESFSQF